MGKINLSINIKVDYVIILNFFLFNLVIDFILFCLFNIFHIYK